MIEDDKVIAIFASAFDEEPRDVDGQLIGEELALCFRGDLEDHFIQDLDFLEKYIAFVGRAVDREVKHLDSYCLLEELCLVCNDT